MLRAHVVVGAVIAPLQHGQEALQAVSAGLPSDIFADLVIDGFVGLGVREAGIPRTKRIGRTQLLLGCCVQRPGTRRRRHNT